MNNKKIIGIILLMLSLFLMFLFFHFLDRPGTDRICFEIGERRVQCISDLKSLIFILMIGCVVIGAWTVVTGINSKIATMTKDSPKQYPSNLKDNYDEGIPKPSLNIDTSQIQSSVISYFNHSLSYLRSIPQKTWRTIIIVLGILAAPYGIIAGILGFLIWYSTDSTFAKKLLKISAIIWIIWIVIIALGILAFYVLKEGQYI